MPCVKKIIGIHRALHRRIHQPVGIALVHMQIALLPPEIHAQRRQKQHCRQKKKRGAAAGKIAFFHHLSAPCPSLSSIR